MATEETTITELELAEEVLADMVIPVDTSTDTKSVSLKQLRAWLGSSLPTGFIIASFGKMDDERFTLLDGKTLSKQGTYGAFCAKVEEQVQAGKWFACSEEEYNADLLASGKCSKFVIGVDYVRIPKLGNSLYSEVIDGKIPVFGNGMTLGMTDGTNKFGIARAPQDAGISGYTSISLGKKVGSSNSFSGDPNRKVLGITTDQTKSGIEGKLETNPVEVFYYMVISTEGQTANVEIDINKVYEDLNLKANTNLSNLTAEGKSLASGLGMPSDRYIDLSVGATGTDYTAPANGYFALHGVAVGGASTYIELINISKAHELGSCQQAVFNGGLRVFVPCLKGEVVRYYNNNARVDHFRFYYAEGDN